jgi:hypothetical protein
VRALDEYEGVAAGAYTRDQTDVVCAGDRVTALIYLATDTRYKAPSARYVGALIRGATAFAVPDPYVERLRGLRG